MSERQRLLGGYTADPDEDELAVSVSVTPTNSGFTTINCQICSSVINLEGKQSQHVVKCTQCNEATPIKPAPPGRRYVRCSCNCLLICKSTGTKVACPRDNCRRVISLSPAGTGTYGTPAASGNANTSRLQVPLPGQLYCLCGHCGMQFTVVSAVSSSVAKCDHCGRTSSVGPQFARRRWMSWLSVAFVFAAAVVVAAVLTWRRAVHGDGAYFVLYAGLSLLCLICLIRSCIFCRTKISVVESRGIGV